MSLMLQVWEDTFYMSHLQLIKFMYGARVVILEQINNDIFTTLRHYMPLKGAQKDLISRESGII